nr:MAG TPA: hypothetical protein [Caudoviricetes sp.]
MSPGVYRGDIYGKSLFNGFPFLFKRAQKISPFLYVPRRI